MGTNQGPAPADTVTITKIQAPVRTHSVITPKVTRIEPELQVNKYTVEVPVAVPQPYKVHPVQQVVETPVIDQHHVTVHQPVAVAHHAVAAPVAVAGAYAHHAVAAPAVQTVAAPVAHAGAITHHPIAATALHAGAYPGAYAHPHLVAAVAKTE